MRIFDMAIIGAGVFSSAIARELSRYKLICVCEHQRWGYLLRGNLVHPAEPADNAAISGRFVARQVKKYLNDSNWRSEKSVQIKYDESEKRWISPNILDMGQFKAPRNCFTLRVADFHRKSRLRISQGDRCLWQKDFGVLVPNRPVCVPDKFLKSVDAEEGSIRFSIH